MQYHHGIIFKKMFHLVTLHILNWNLLLTQIMVIFWYRSNLFKCTDMYTCLLVYIYLKLINMFINIKWLLFFSRFSFFTFDLIKSNRNQLYSSRTSYHLWSFHTKYYMKIEMNIRIIIFPVLGSILLVLGLSKWRFSHH